MRKAINSESELGLMDLSEILAQRDSVMAAFTKDELLSGDQEALAATQIEMAEKPESKTQGADFAS